MKPLWWTSRGSRDPLSHSALGPANITVLSSEWAQGRTLLWVSWLFSCEFESSGPSHEEEATGLARLDTCLPLRLDMASLAMVF